MWLPKATAFATGDHGEVQVPAVLTGPVQMEAELALVVGRPSAQGLCVRRPRRHFRLDGLQRLHGHRIRLWAARRPLWATAKSIDGFTSWGPWIRRDLSEERVMQGLEIHGYVNGEKRQDGNYEVVRLHAQRNAQPRQPPHRPQAG